MKTSVPRRALLIGITALSLVLPGFAAHADTAPDAQQFITKLMNSALATLANTKASNDQREQTFGHMLSENFDIPRISRFVLGRYWNAASEQDRQKFAAVYREFIVRSYAARFSDYSGETVKVTNTRPEGNDTVVNSEIVHPDGSPPIKISWRVHQNGGDFKIVDVDVEGVSMMLAQREEFTSYIQRGDGTVAGLIAALQKKMSGG